MAMRANGLSYREAKAVLDALVIEMKISLAHEGNLCLDWGALHEVRPPGTERVWRFGRVMTITRPAQYVILPI
jgi:hypothetical protein